MFSQQSVKSKPFDTTRRNRKANRAGYADANYPDSKIKALFADQIGERGIQQTIKRKSVKRHCLEATQFIPIMDWWRLKPLASISTHDLPRLKRCIRGFEIIGDPRWRAAEAGDVPAAIAVAIRLVKQGLVVTPVMNLAGTALLIAAIKGDATARLMIEYLAGLKTEDCFKQCRNQLAATVHQLQKLIASEMEACS